MSFSGCRCFGVNSVSFFSFFSLHIPFFLQGIFHHISTRHVIMLENEMKDPELKKRFDDIFRDAEIVQVDIDWKYGWNEPIHVPMTRKVIELISKSVFNSANKRLTVHVWNLLCGIVVL